MERADVVIIGGSAAGATAAVSCKRRNPGKSIILVRQEKEVSHTLIDARLDRLWISLDGTTPESYSDVRLGAALPMILDNLSYFYKNNYMELDVRDCGHPVQR